MKRRMIAGLMLGGMLATIPAVASAEAEGGCPPGGTWSLASFNLAVPEVDKGDLSDANGDGRGCYKVETVLDWDYYGGLLGVVVWMDNSEPLAD